MSDPDWDTIAERIMETWGELGSERGDSFRLAVETVVGPLLAERDDEIERLRDIVRDFAKESTYSDALIANLLDPGSDQ